MLNSYLLWFLPLAVAPLLLHLLTLRRLRTVELSTFRFLMDSFVQQRRRLKLLEYFVLALRVAFVAACVLMLCRPVIQRYAGLFGGQSGGQVDILIDVGPSMALRTGLTSSMQRAKDAARAVIGLVEPQVKINVICAGRRPRRLASRFARHGNLILNEIDRLEPDTVAGDMAAGLEMLLEADPQTHRNIFLISDGNRGTWATLEGHAVVERFSAETKFVVINVGPSESVSNLTVFGTPPVDLRAVAGLPLQLTASVVNRSEEPKDTVLSVMLDQKQVRRLSLTLVAGERISRTVSLTPSRPGLVRGSFELPADDFPDDDVFMFCLNVEAPMHVLIVTDDREGASPQEARRYLMSALRSPQDVAAHMGPAEAKLAESMQVTAVSDAQLEDALLEKADVVILSDVSLDEGQADRLRSYVESGGGLFILPGPGIDRAAYHRLVQTSSPGPGGPAGTPLVLLDAPVGEIEDESQFVPIGSVDLSHGVLRAFDETDAEYFKTIRLYRYFPIRESQTSESALEGATSRGPRAHVLIGLPDGAAALVQMQFGEGRIILAAVPATTAWSNLPLTGEFVALVLRAVVHLRRPSLAVVPVAVRPHEPAPIALTDRWPDANVQVVDPNDRTHAVGLLRSGRRLVGAMSETGAKGYYTFSVLPRTSGAVQRMKMGFAVNLDMARISLDRADEQTLTGLLELPAARQAENVTYVSGAPGEAVLHEQLRHKREIWRDLIALAFVFILAEFLLSTLSPHGETVREHSWWRALQVTFGRLGWRLPEAGPVREADAEVRPGKVANR